MTVMEAVKLESMTGVRATELLRRNGISESDEQNRGFAQVGCEELLANLSIVGYGDEDLQMFI